MITGIDVFLGNISFYIALTSCQSKEHVPKLFFPKKTPLNQHLPKVGNEVMQAYGSCCMRGFRVTIIPVLFSPLFSRLNYLIMQWMEEGSSESPVGGGSQMGG